MAVKKNLKSFFVIVALLVCSAAAQDDPNAQYLILQSGEAASEPREIEVPVEVGLLRLQFNLQAGRDIQWTIITPSGKPMTLTDPNVAVNEAGDRRTISLWDPRPGLWKIRLSG
ncbi:MAG: hypothetical protein ACREEM_28285, partial [Blastocatellia bacterium]